MEKYEDPVYDPSLLDKIPDEYKDYTLEKLVGNRIELENFQVFLKENYADTDLLCWMAIRTFRNIPYTDEKARDELATSIRDRFLNQKYFFGPNSPAGKKGQEKVSFDLFRIYSTDSIQTHMILRLIWKSVSFINITV